MAGTLRVFWDHKQQLVIPIAGPNALAMGTHQSNDVVLPDRHVSKHHLALVATTDSVAVMDLHSRNGTYVNGTRIKSKTTLKYGDLIQLGYVSMVYLDDKPDSRQGISLSDVDA